jgi:F0F1-type ATP synthase assembly protein I
VLTTVSKNKQPANPPVMGDVLGLVNRIAIAVILIIVVAIGLGTLLDRWLETERLFTFLLVLLSIPVTMTAVYKISMAAVARVQAADNNSEENTTT